MNRVLAVVLSTVLLGGCTVTKVSKITGWPYLVEYEDILVAKIEPFDEWTSYKLFEEVKQELDEDFGTLSYLPQVEYDLKAEGMTTKEIAQIGDDVAFSAHAADILGVTYFLRITYESGACQFVSDYTTPNDGTYVRFRIDVVDLADLTVSSSFFSKADHIPLPLGGGVWLDVTTVNAMIGKALRRAGRQIRKEKVHRDSKWSIE
ncbi:hypothetical protein [Reichenbachiella agariperforans]|uniref:hypothetical protein n=1 Tax=Reichenbachiella agariperforans TaxID=156994 RepID=UPI001C090DBC|nr:hypothetical protein [Reichenbachiella agariperforans]MBU2913534.1 hypothetical protein [Reichenbachiella agariperforans]